MANVRSQDLLQDNEWSLYESLDGQYCTDDNGQDDGDRYSASFLILLFTNVTCSVEAKKNLKVQLAPAPS